MPNRCKARNCCRGFYYDPVTFNVPVAPTGAVFENSESPEKAGVEGVDEVSSDLISVTWLILVPRSIDYSSSY